MTPLREGKQLARAAAWRGVGPERKLRVLEEKASTKKSSEEEHRVDAQAPYAEEGRGQLRKATRSRKQTLIRGYPNGGTRRESCPVTHE